MSSTKKKELKTVFVENFNNIHDFKELLYSMINARNEDDAKSKVYSKLKTIIKKANIKGEIFEKLENDILRIKGNPLSIIKNCLPQISDLSYMVYVYSILDIKPYQIHSLTLLSPTQIYNAKKRIKFDLKRVSSQESSYCLGFLE